MSLANRRHHYERLKRRRRHYWGRDLQPDELGKAIDTPKPCSCYGCGNPRKWFGELTVQERRHAE